VYLIFLIAKGKSLQIAPSPKLVSRVGALLSSNVSNYGALYADASGALWIGMRSTGVDCKRQGKHTIDRFNRSGFAAFTTIDGMTTVPASSRIGLGAKWKSSEGAR
jgi:hypothetical protein